MEDPARRNYLLQFSCFSNTQYDRPKNGLSKVSGGYYRRMLFLSSSSLYYQPLHFAAGKGLPEFGIVIKVDPRTSC